ncbi:hypothetical protein [Caproiciproducens sp.]
MTDKEIIARQAEKIIELEDKLAEQTESSSYWYGECQKYKNCVPVVPQTMDETIKVLEGIAK